MFLVDNLALFFLLTTTSVNLDPHLVYAIIQNESDGKSQVTRYEKHYKHFFKAREFSKQLNIAYHKEIKNQKTAWGLMQITGGTARYLGFKGNLEDLLKPELNLKYGIKYLTYLNRKYPNRNDLIASYNAGRPRIINGKYYNHGYYLDVLRKYNKLKTDYPNEISYLFSDGPLQISHNI